MKVLDLLKLRDGMAVNQVILDLELGEDDEKKVIDALDKSGQRWAETHLPDLLGQDAAKELLRQTYETNSGTKTFP